MNRSSRWPKRWKIGPGQAGWQGWIERCRRAVQEDRGRFRDLAKKDETDKHEALLKLNYLAQQLEQRRDKLAAGEKLKDQLAGMKSLPSGPADKLAQDLKNGNLDKALRSWKSSRSRWRKAS